MADSKPAAREEADGGGRLRPRPLDPFDAGWARLEEVGRCDASGGCAYERVRAAWEACPADQRPDPIAFIERSS